MSLKPKNRLDPYTGILLAIIAVNALLKWRFFCGLVQADDFSYGVYSYTMFKGIWPWNMEMDFRMLRMGLMFPVSMVFMILPPTEFTAVLFPMLASFGTLVMVYLIGKKLYDPNAGIFGAFIIATFPADVIFGTMILPDILVPFYLSVAVWMFLNADSGEGLKQKVWYALTGFFVFLAFVTRENSYYFLLFFLPFAFNPKRWKQGLYCIGLGFALPVTVVYGIYYLKTGDFLFNVHLATYARDPQIVSGYIPPNSVNWLTQLKYMLPVLNPVRRNFLSPMYGMTFYIGIPCLIYTAVMAYRKNNYKHLIIPWWFLIGYLFLEFGTISFSHFQMMKKLPRFLLTVTPAMAICCGVVMNEALGFGARRIKKMKDIQFRKFSGSIAMVLLALMLFSSYVIAAGQKKSRDANMEQFRWGYNDVLKKRPNRPVYQTGGWWNNKLSFYFLPDVRYADINGRRSEILRDLKEVKNPSELAGSYVLIDRKHFTGQNDLRIQHSYDDFGSFVLAPPQEWKLIGNKFFVEIYEVPGQWSYREPDGKALIREAFVLAAADSDPMRFLYCLHPMYRQNLDRDSFYNLINTLKNMGDSERSAYLDEHLRYGEDQGKWKVYFDSN